MVMGMELLREMPVIRRAREFHLYDNAGKRLLDLYLNGGKALLGHRPEGFSLIVKNTLARGVTAEYPSHEEGKMLKAAQALWGKSHPQIRYYRDIARLRVWLDDQKILPSGSPFPDPAFVQAERISLWRPWLPEREFPEFIVPVLPGSRYGIRGAVLCIGGDNKSAGRRYPVTCPGGRTQPLPLVS